MSIQDEIYDVFSHAGGNMSENQGKFIRDLYIIKRGHSPNGWYSLANKDRIRLQLSPVCNNWEYVQLNETMFLWYENKIIKKLIAYSFYPDETTRAYYECDFHIESIIRKRIPPTILTRKYCNICADNLLGREIRGCYINLGERGKGNGFVHVSVYDQNSYFRTAIPPDITGIWPFNKWFQRYLRRNRNRLSFTPLPREEQTGAKLITSSE